MSDLKTAHPILEMYPGESQVGAWDCRQLLRDGVLIDSVTSITEQTTSVLTWSNEAKNSGAETIRGDTVAIGKAVLAKVAVDGSADPGEYHSVLTLATDSTPAGAPKGRITIRVLDPEA